MRLDKPSLRLARDDEAMETAPAHTNGNWELHIINDLISHCNVGHLKQIDNDISTDTGSEFEDSDPGYIEDEPVPVEKSKREKRRREQVEKQNAGKDLLQCCNDIAHGRLCSAYAL